MTEISAAGIDLTKEVIAVCGVDRLDKTVFSGHFATRRSRPGQIRFRAILLPRGT